MKPKNAILLMLGVLFLAVIISMFLIFLETSIPVVLILALGVIYIIIIDVILLKKGTKEQPKIQPKLQARIDPLYNNLLKTSIDLNDKISKLNEREKQLKRIAEDAKKTIKLNSEVKKHIKSIRPQRKYVASILSNKFHLKACKFTKLIDYKNKVFFKTKNQALKQGFKPCNELKR